MFTLKNYLNGNLVAPTSGRYIDNFEPATGKKYSQLPNSNFEDVALAVKAAKYAFKDWSELSPVDRSQWLMKIAVGIENNLNKLAMAESKDTGKPITLARTLDIPRAAANSDFLQLQSYILLHRHIIRIPTP